MFVSPSSTYIPLESVSRRSTYLDTFASKPRPLVKSLEASWIDFPCHTWCSHVPKYLEFNRLFSIPRICSWDISFGSCGPIASCVPGKCVKRVESRTRAGRIRIKTVSIRFSSFPQVLCVKKSRPKRAEILVVPHRHFFNSSSRYSAPFSEGGLSMGSYAKPENFPLCLSQYIRPISNRML
jgi:hypothetical protein